MLSLLDLVLELAHSMQVGADISSCLLLVLLDEVVDDVVIEVGTLSLLDLVLELAHSTQVGADISSCLLLVLLDKVVDDVVIEVLTTKVGVTSSCQDLEDTIVN